RLIEAIRHRENPAASEARTSALAKL
ncbi:hypothetical protein WYO_3973, partial [Methylobacterium sp. GXF4]